MSIRQLDKEGRLEFFAGAPIMDAYEEVFSTLENKHGKGVVYGALSDVESYASLEKCIAYTRQYVVQRQEGDLYRRSHYRYGRYRDALCAALRHLDFDCVNRRIVHLDIGCGPGVFSWVVYDYMELQNVWDSPVEYYGYDHCRKMIELAELIQEGLPVEYEFRGFSKHSEIATALKERDFRGCNVLVTFGHSLVQVRSHRSALREFAGLVGQVFPAPCCLVIAVDAKGQSETFRTQWDLLEDTIEKQGVIVERRGSVRTDESTMFARLRKE